MFQDRKLDIPDGGGGAWCAWEDTPVSLEGWTPNPRYADPAFRMVSGPLDTPWASAPGLAPGSRLIVGDDAGHGGGSFASELITVLNSYRILTGTIPLVDP